MIKAIDTYYNRNYFRSRLEAKWAVFFDLLKIRWRYESVGFELGGGKRYLPDFYFPDYDFYGEVKPQPIEDKRWFDFVRLSEKRLVIFTDLPHMQTSKLYQLINNNGEQVEVTDVIPFAFLLKPGYGLFLHPGDSSANWNEHFKEQIKKANCMRFTNEWQTVKTKQQLA